MAYRFPADRGLCDTLLTTGQSLQLPKGGGPAIVLCYIIHFGFKTIGRCSLEVLVFAWFWWPLWVFIKKKNQCVKSSTPKGYNTLGTPQGVTAWTHTVQYFNQGKHSYFPKCLSVLCSEHSQILSSDPAKSLCESLCRVTENQLSFLLFIYSVFKRCYICTKTLANKWS